MLSEALLPLADKYAPAQPVSDVPMLPGDIDALTATSAEQLQQHLLGYSENHPRSYADKTAGDDDFGKAFSLQTGFYDQNFGGNDPWFNYEGVGGASVGLFDTGAGILSGLAYAISNPGEALEAMFLGTHQLVFDTPGFIGDINAAHNQAQLNAYLDYLQGDYFSSAYTSTMGDLTFGMEWAGLIPANRTWQLGRLGGDVVPNSQLKPVGLTFDRGTRTWTTPAGLDYGPGSIHGNRVKHVLDHAAPNPNKTTHSVFNVDRNQVLTLVDEAWLTRGNPLPNDPGAYVVQMGRKVGTAGETNLKIIVRPETNQIITAYPVR